jgi:hypothetical protein
MSIRLDRNSRIAQYSPQEELEIAQNKIDMRENTQQQQQQQQQQRETSTTTTTTTYN